MAGNTTGQIFRLTTFGESHGAAIGGVVDGCPAGMELSAEDIQKDLDRRKPGQSEIVTQRKGSDTVELLSGIFEGRTTGTPIGFIIRNEDQKSKDYSHIKDKFRPSHADFTFVEKYGIRDYRGGGRSSARETACRVVAGAIAKTLLRKIGVEINAYVSRIENLSVEKPWSELDLKQTESNIVRCPDPEIAEKMIQHLKSVRKDGDTVGGEISCVAQRIPAGWGEPVFDKLHADLAKAIMSINAAKGFELGSGVEGTRMRGSEHTDPFVKTESGTSTSTNHSGGIQGGISNGQPIYFNVGFKPIATLMRDQQSVDEKGEPAVVKGKGRHDPCVLPRAVPIVEAMTAIVLADHYLRQRSAKI
jgi:chorismate synthase